MNVKLLNIFRNISYIFMFIFLLCVFSIWNFGDIAVIYANENLLDFFSSNLILTTIFILLLFVIISTTLLLKKMNYNFKEFRYFKSISKISLILFPISIVAIVVFYGDLKFEDMSTILYTLFITNMITAILSGVYLYGPGVI